MAEQSLLETIAQKERDLRARLLAARARAAALVAEAERTAEELRAAEEAAAAAEVEAWLAAELARAQREVAELVAQASVAQGPVDAERLAAAVAVILDAVLLRPPAASAAPAEPAARGVIPPGG